MIIFKSFQKTCLEFLKFVATLLIYYLLNFLGVFAIFLAIWAIYLTHESYLSQNLNKIETFINFTSIGVVIFGVFIIFLKKNTNRFHDSIFLTSLYKTIKVFSCFLTGSILIISGLLIAGASTLLIFSTGGFLDYSYLLIFLPVTISISLLSLLGLTFTGICFVLPSPLKKIRVYLKSFKKEGFTKIILIFIITYIICILIHSTDTIL